MFKIHHIAISVSDINKSLDFYKIFGFKRVLYWKSEDSNLEIIHLKLDDFFLELFCFKNNIKLPIYSRKLSTDLPQIGVKHFGLKVENIEKIKKIFLEKKIAKNIEINLGKNLN